MSHNTKTILIIGAGESGLGVAMLAAQQGYHIRVSDSGNLSPQTKDVLQKLKAVWEEGKHTLQLLEGADLLVKSPGVRPSNPLVVQAEEKNVPVISDIEFGYMHTSKPIIAITGTNGKSTATALIHHLLICAGLRAVACGNIGLSFCRAIVEKPDADWWVVEVSSFQLAHTVNFRPRIAILLNITPDHLDWHSSLEDYIRAKLKICQNLTPADHFLFNAQDSVITSRLTTISLRGTLHPLHPARDNTSIDSTLFIHPVTLAAVYKVAEILNIQKETVENALQTFKGLPHRLQPAGKIGRVTFINDSKATNIASTQFALERLPAPIVWIMGGLDKGNDYTPLTQLIKEKVRAIVVHARKPRPFINALKEFCPTILTAKTMEAAVQLAWQAAENEGIVLLSPACASFDLYKNFAERGTAFIKAVQKLKNTLQTQHAQED